MIGLADFDAEVMSFEDGAFLVAEVGEGFIVVREGLDFVGERADVVALFEEDLVAGGFAVIEFLLFGIPGVFSELAGFAGSAYAFEVCADHGDGVVDFDHDLLFLFFEGEEGLFEGGAGGAEVIAGGDIAEGHTELDGDTGGGVGAAADVIEGTWKAASVGSALCGAGDAVGSDEVEDGVELIFLVADIDVSLAEG